MPLFNKIRDELIRSNVSLRDAVRDNYSLLSSLVRPSPLAMKGTRGQDFSVRARYWFDEFNARILTRLININKSALTLVYLDRKIELRNIHVSSASSCNKIWFGSRICARDLQCRTQCYNEPGEHAIHSQFIHYSLMVYTLLYKTPRYSCNQ